jgi:hypothetical protein
VSTYTDFTPSSVLSNGKNSVSRYTFYHTKLKERRAAPLVSIKKFRNFQIALKHGEFWIHNTRLNQ